MNESAVMELAQQNGNGAVTAEVMEKVIVGGDLSRLTPAQRVGYYRRVCESLGLNPLTKPFQYIVLNGKMTLYATRDCTDQLRSLRGISVEKLEREATEGIYVVTAYGRDRSGRVDSSTGAVPIENVRGEARANAVMKAETKAKRRLTLSLAGLGWLDEVEVDSVPSVQAIEVNTDTGEIERQPAPSLRESIAERRAALEAPTRGSDSAAGGAVGPEEQAATGDVAPPTEPVAAAAQCESTSPYEGSARCRDIAGHKGLHRGGDKESWQ